MVGTDSGGRKQDWVVRVIGFNAEGIGFFVFNPFLFLYNPIGF
jgi:hypothetical protein